MVAYDQEDAMNHPADLRSATKMMFGLTEKATTPFAACGN